ncbi:MAG: hypothetical protein MJY67_00750 [Bacteroidales bacterium]|nr:hypothetical protein [Bacteroidales bacterium]
MKKNIIIAGIVVAASLAACQKSSFDSVVPSNDGQKVTLTVCAQEWTEEGTKTAYTPGTGVDMSGQEVLALYYCDQVEDYSGETVVKPVLVGMEGSESKAVRATSADGGQTYTFTAPAASAGKRWHAITGYSKQNITLVSDKSAPGVILSPVQHPAANSFDPNFDFMMAQPFYVDGEAGTAKINCFKRLLAPLRVQVSGLPAGETIYSATFELDQEPEVNTSNDALVGKIYLQLAEDYENNSIGYSEYGAKGNAVTAVYAEGLEAIEGNWPVWFIVNPITIQEGTSLKMTVSTSNKTYTRTVALPGQASLKRSALNNIKFNIAGEGSTQQSSFTTVFTSAPALNGSATLKASDGNNYNWKFSANVRWDAAGKDNSTLANAMNLNNQSVTIPTFYDYNATGLIVVSHAINNLSMIYDSSLTLRDGAEDLVTYGFNFCSTAQYDFSILPQGGTLAVALPAGKTTLEGMSLVGSARPIAVSAITVFVEEGGEVTPTVDPATGDDLYTEFMAGKYIEIGGVRYTKDDVSAVFNDDLGSVSNSDFQKAGIHFLTGTKDFGSGANLKFPSSAIYISRHPSQKASISASQFQPYADVTFKNMEIICVNSNNGFPSNQATADGTYTFEDCVINCNGALSRDVHATYSVNYVVKNCQITFKANALVFLNKKVATSHTANKYVFEGNTLNATAPIPVIDLTNGVYNAPELVISFKNNTVTGAAWASGLIMFKQIKSIAVEGNTFSASDASALLGSAGTVGEASTVKGNTMPEGWTVFSGDPIANVTVE